jgi:hypothetical protein
LIENGNYFEYLAQELRRIPQDTKDYANVSFSSLDYVAQRWLLWRLERSSKNDHGSNELLNFGFHILAVKE